MRILLVSIFLFAACSKPQEKEATVKQEPAKVPAAVTTAGAVTGQTPEQMVEEAKKVAEAAQANLDEKGAGMTKDD
ncbi:hypothetical protein EPO15_16955 [bacterium]|nr:MAG: hypothetical protein EPO15_16955 [bacterium]